MRCEFTGCKAAAKWACRKLWGAGGVIHTCDEHRPGSKPLPAGVKSPRPFYDVKPVARPS